MDGRRGFLTLLLAGLAAGGAGCRPGGGAVNAAPPAPGEFREASFTARGITRNYRLYVPARAGRQRPLVVMLHGCTQDAADLARGTRMNAVADRERWLVLYPEQPATAEQYKCWNWFDPQHTRRETGEAAYLAALVRAVMEEHRTSEDRVWLAGISAGAAMGAAVVANEPGLFAAFAAHSGLPWGLATDRPSALTAMRNGPPDSAKLGERLAAHLEKYRAPVPVLVLHGRQDKVAVSANGLALAQQWAWVAGKKLGVADPAAYVAAASWRQVPGDSAVQRHAEACWPAPGGACLVAFVELDALGHAWSGGDSAGTYTDPRTPSATDAIVRFFKSWSR